MNQLANASAPMNVHFQHVVSTKSGTLAKPCRKKHVTTPRTMNTRNLTFTVEPACPYANRMDVNVPLDMYDTKANVFQNRNVQYVVKMKSGKIVPWAAVHNVHFRKRSAILERHVCLGVHVKKGLHLTMIKNVTQTINVKRENACRIWSGKSVEVTVTQRVMYQLQSVQNNVYNPNVNVRRDSS